MKMRICEEKSSLEDFSAITALTQCSVHDLSMAIEDMYKGPIMPAWQHMENKWLAARHGLDAIITFNAQGDVILVTDHLRAAVKHLAPVAEKLAAPTNFCASFD